MMQSGAEPPVSDYNVYLETIDGRRRLRPRAPGQDPRYDGPVGSLATAVYSHKRTAVIAAGIFNDQQEFDRAWKMYIHPEGKPYFYNQDARVLTSSDILVPSVRKEIETMWGQLCLDIEVFRSGNTWPVDFEIVMELNGEEFCDYYCVSFPQKTVFWLTAGGEWLDLPDDASSATIRLTLEQEYWTHTAFFPMHRALSIEDEECLRGILIFSCADRMTAPGSTAHISPDECRQYLVLLEDSKKLTTLPGPRTWLISRLMTTITRNRIHNLWGQDTARLDRSQNSISPQSAPDTFVKRSLQGALVQSLLFYAPAECEKSLNLVVVDDIILPDIWRTFMLTCQRDWRMTMAVALVLLLANAAFLSSRGTNGLLLDMIVASAIFSTSSLATGLYMLQTHRGLESSHGHVAAAYLLHNESSSFGYTPLAIRLSLPYILMIWSLVFLSAVILIRAQH